MRCVADRAVACRLAQEKLDIPVQKKTFVDLDRENKERARERLLVSKYGPVQSLPNQIFRSQQEQ